MMRSAGMVRSAVAGALLLPLLGFLLVYVGTQQFGGFDQSVLIETAHRCQVGQRPYVDFFTAAPVGFVLGGHLALAAFGPQWTSFVFMLVLYASLVFVVQAFCASRVAKSGGFLLLLASSTYVCAAASVGYWWYNSHASLSGAAAISAVLLAHREPQRARSWLLLTATLAGLGLAKPNVAGPSLVIAVGFLLWSSPRRSAVLASVGAAAALCMLLLIARDISPMAVVHSYAAAAGRGAISFSRFSQDQSPGLVLTSLLVIAVAALPALLALRTGVWRDDRAGGVALILLALVAVYAFLTNGEPKLTDLPLLLVPTGMLAFAVPAGGPEAPRGNGLRAAQVSWVIAASLALLLGTHAAVTRVRIKLIGPFYQDAPLVEIDRVPDFFLGFLASPWFAELLLDIDKVLADIGRPSSGVFFGPRMEFAYQAFDVASPRELPVYWHPGISFSVAESAAIGVRFDVAHFQLAVFARDDFTYVPAEVLAVLDRDFDREDGRHLTVFRRRAAVVRPRRVGPTGRRWRSRRPRAQDCHSQNEPVVR